MFRVCLSDEFYSIQEKKDIFSEKYTSQATREIPAPGLAVGLAIKREILQFWSKMLEGYLHGEISFLARIHSQITMLCYSKGFESHKFQDTGLKGLNDIFTIGSPTYFIMHIICTLI